MKDERKNKEKSNALFLLVGSLPRDAFSTLSESLLRIDLSRNELAHMEDGALTGLGHVLFFNLSRNDLTRFNSEVFEGKFKVKVSLRNYRWINSLNLRSFTKRKGVRYFTVGQLYMEKNSSFYFPFSYRKSTYVILKHNRKNRKSIRFLNITGRMHAWILSESEENGIHAYMGRI